MTTPSQNQNPERKPVIQRIVVLILTLLFVSLVYTFLHESGHALLGLIFGGKLTAFNINFFDLSAHVSFNGNFSENQNMLISIGGVTTPLVLWALWMIWVPRRTHPILEWLKILSSASFINSLLAWIILPWFYLAGSSPSDDSIAFISISRLPPWLVSIMALLVYLACAWLAWYKLEGLHGIKESLRTVSQITIDPSGLRILRWMAAIMGVILLAAVVINQTPGALDSSVRAPQGYDQVAQISLKGEKFSRHAIYQFELDHPARISLYFHLEKINSGPLVIEMSGPGGLQQEFARFSDSIIGNGEASVHPKDLELGIGAYQILLTSVENPGKITLYFKDETSP